MKRASILCMVAILVCCSAWASVVNYKYDAAGRLSGVEYEGVRRESIICDQMGNVVCTGDACEIYVEKNRSCGANRPCYPTIAQGIGASGYDTTVNIASDSSFAEHVVAEPGVQVVVETGWNSDFTAKTDTPAVIEGSLTIASGSLVIGSVVIQAQAARLRPVQF